MASTRIGRRERAALESPQFGVALAFGLFAGSPAAADTIDEIVQNTDALESPF
jgi:hypothetical protein